MSGMFILSYYMFYDMYNLFKILLMHNGCQAFYKTIEEQKEVDKEQRLIVFNSIIKTMHTMIKRIKFQLEHQHNREELKYQNPDLSFNTKSNATPTVDNKHASFMSKYKSDNEDSKESTFKGEEIEILQSNTKEYIRSKQDIIKFWKADVKNYRSRKLKQKMKGDGDHTKSRNPNYKINDADHNSDKEEEINDNINVTDEELEIANEFLDKFILESESSIEGHIDMILVLKSIPDQITLNTLSRAELFKFKVFQSSLIAHQNADIVDAFEYFDQRNKDRVYSIKDKLLDQKKELESIRQTLSNQVLTKISSKSSDQSNMNPSKREEKPTMSHRIISATNKREEVKKKLNFAKESRSESKKRPSSYIANNEKINENSEEEK